MHVRYVAKCFDVLVTGERIQVITWSIGSGSHTAYALNNTCSWAEDVSQALSTITVDLLFSIAQQTIYYIPI